MVDRSTSNVVVSGVGMLCSLGNTADNCWNALVKGESGARSTVQDFGEEFPVKVFAPVEDHDKYGPYGIQRAFGFLELVIQDAIGQANLPFEKVSDCQLILAICPFDQTWDAKRDQMDSVDEPYALFHKLGSPRSDIIDRTAISKLLEQLMERFELSRMPMMLHTACSSGNSAIQFGLEAIQSDDVNVALIAGCEISTSAEALVRFNLLGTLAKPTDNPADAARPFSKDRGGFVLGEGAAAMVLERADGCTTPHLGYVLGAGDSMDTYHRTRSDPEATAAIRAVDSALKNSGLRPDDIDCVNAHGTGTMENDKTEATCIQMVFGERGRSIPVTSNKSIVGHTLSTAGVIEGIFCIKSLQTGIIPPTLNYETPDPEIDINVVTTAQPSLTLTRIISNSFGFGGQNVCVIFGK